MAEDILSQDQIDSLMQTIELGEFEDESVNDLRTPLNPDEVKYKYNDIVASKERLDYALLNGTFEETKDAANNLHNAAFNNWLLKKGLSRKEYYLLMNREAVKRGIRPPFFHT